MGQNISTRRLQDAVCADISGDGTVSVDDLLALLSAYGGSNLDADFDDDGMVGVNDLLALLAQYGSDCTGTTSPEQPEAAAACPALTASYTIDYQFTDISTTGTEILDSEWTNPLNTWNHDDGTLDVDFEFDFTWYQNIESTMSIGTNGMISFGTDHLRNGGSEPIPCVNLCGNNNYGSHANHADWGIDGVIAPFWADINPGSSLDGVDENGAVFYQMFAGSAVVQWNECTYWTPDNNPTAQTFEAVMWADGGVMFSYASMDPAHLSWSVESIGYEDASGTLGAQISYGEIPESATTYYIPPVCTDMPTGVVSGTTPAVPSSYDGSTCPTDYDGYVVDPYWVDIVSSGTEIADDSWSNPLNTWNHDDGYIDVPLPFSFNWYGIMENTISIGTNGLITFGTGHLRNGGSEPIPCLSAGLCDGNNYGSHANHADWGVDGVIAPFWADVNPGSSLDGVDETGAVYFQIFEDAVVVQWDQCTYWTPDNNPTTNTFEAILFASGDVIFSYFDMAPEAGHLSWSEESIGYEDQSGAFGYQIAYSFTSDPNAIPADGTTFYIPAVCTTAPPPPPPSPPVDAVTTSYPINHMTNTCEEYIVQSGTAGGSLTTGSMNLANSDIDFGSDRFVMFNFPDVDVPAGTTPLAAALVFMVEDIIPGRSDLELNMKIQGVTDGTACAGTPFTISGASLTAAEVTWSPESPAGECSQVLGCGQDGPIMTTTDVSTIVAELTGAAGYTPGDPMSFVITYVSGDGDRQVHSRPTYVESAPALSVTIGGSSSPAPPPFTGPMITTLYPVTSLAQTGEEFQAAIAGGFAPVGLRVPGSMNMGDGDLDFMYSFDEQVVKVLITFPAVAVPADAEVVAAALQFQIAKIDDDQNDADGNDYSEMPMTIMIEGVAGNALPPCQQTWPCPVWDASNRAKTPTTVFWEPEASIQPDPPCDPVVGCGANAPALISPDVSQIVSEILASDGWTGGDDAMMGFVLSLADGSGPGRRWVHARPTSTGPPTLSVSVADTSGR